MMARPWQEIRRCDQSITSTGFTTRPARMSATAWLIALKG
jgi:hypothetical protein